MLTVDPNKRFSINDIINHEWVKLDADVNLSVFDSLRIK